MNGLCTTNVSRRGAVAAAFGGVSLLMPTSALAETAQSFDPVTRSYLARPDISALEFENLLQQQAETEALRLIEQALAYQDTNTLAGGRPTYDTVYGSTYTRSTGWHDVAGQPDGGVRIANGGSIFVSPSGGVSVSVSVPLPGGLGNISVSVPTAKRSHTVTGYAVNISGSHFYKATANVTYHIKPYVVYETKNGVRKVYMKQAVQNFYNIDLSTRIVG